jgi:hypothetical protein
MITVSNALEDINSNFISVKALCYTIEIHIKCSFGLIPETLQEVSSFSTLLYFYSFSLFVPMMQKEVLTPLAKYWVTASKAPVKVKPSGKVLKAQSCYFFV